MSSSPGHSQTPTEKLPVLLPAQSTEEFLTNCESVTLKMFKHRFSAADFTVRIQSILSERVRKHHGRSNSGLVVFQLQYCLRAFYIVRSRPCNYNNAKGNILFDSVTPDRKQLTELRDQSNRTLRLLEQTSIQSDLRNHPLMDMRKTAGKVHLLSTVYDSK